MLRREFLGAAISTSVLPTQKPKSPAIAALIKQLEEAARDEIPGIKTFSIQYSPNDKKVPLMIVAFKA